MLQQQFVTPINDNSATQYEAVLGAIRIEGNRVYKYVKFTGTTAGSPGDSACYVLTDDSMTTVDFANSAIGAGISVGTVASGAVSYGWVQVDGPCTINTLSSGANGNQLTTTGASAKALKVVAAYTDQIAAVCFDATNKVVDLEFPW
jgi:hypothetical protein